MRRRGKEGDRKEGRKGRRKGRKGEEREEHVRSPILLNLPPCIIPNAVYFSFWSLSAFEHVPFSACHALLPFVTGGNLSPIHNWLSCQLF